MRSLAVVEYVSLDGVMQAPAHAVIGVQRDLLELGDSAFVSAFSSHTGGR